MLLPYFRLSAMTVSFLMDYIALRSTCLEKNNMTSCTQETRNFNLPQNDNFEILKILLIEYSDGNKQGKKDFLKTKITVTNRI